MKKHLRLFLLIILLALSTACSLESLLGQSKDGQSRTYYDTLDLSTPEKAVETFTDAFQREDFMTVYLVLDQSTQFVIPQYFRMLDYHPLFRFEDREDVDEIFKDVPCVSEGLGSGEHSCGDMWYVFDDLMRSAKKHDALLIDLSGKVEIIDKEDSETLDGDDAVDVIATVEGIDGEVIFRTMQAPSGKWRVQQVIVDGGGDEEYGPWSVPNTEE